MPIYSHRCPSCGATQDVFNRIADRDANAPVCCGQPMPRQVTAPMVSVSADCHYICPVTGQQVTSQRQRRNIMSEHRLIDANDLKPETVIRERKKKTEARQQLAAQLPGLPPGITKEQVFTT